MKCKKRIHQQNKKTTWNQTIKQESNQRNKYREVHLVGYLEAFLKLAREEVKQMDQRTRKLVTIIRPYKLVIT